MQLIRIEVFVFKAMGQMISGVSNFGLTFQVMVCGSFQTSSECQERLSSSSSLLSMLLDRFKFIDEESAIKSPLAQRMEETRLYRNNMTFPSFCVGDSVRVSFFFFVVFYNYVVFSISLTSSYN